MKAIDDEDTMVRQYRHQVSIFARPTREREQALARGAQNNDEEACHELVMSHLYVVLVVASNLYKKIGRLLERHGVTYLDLVQAGNVGLLIAAKKFKPKRRALFATYASFWVWDQMSKFSYTCGVPIPIPRHQQQRLATMRRDTGNEYEQPIAWARVTSSLDALPIEQRDRLHSLTTTETPESIVEYLSEVQERLKAVQIIMRALEQLPPRQRELFLFRYGLRAPLSLRVQPITQMEVHCGLSKQNASKSLRRAWKNLDRLGVTKNDRLGVTIDAKWLERTVLILRTLRASQ